MSPTESKYVKIIDFFFYYFCLSSQNKYINKQFKLQNTLQNIIPHKKKKLNDVTS
jgi:hypothetical protein